MKKRLDKLIKVIRNDVPHIGQLVQDPNSFRMLSKFIRDIYVYSDKGRLTISDANVIVIHLEDIFIDRNKLRAGRASPRYKYYPGLLVRILNEAYTNVTNIKFDKNPFFYRNTHHLNLRYNLIEP
jgi:hypothetical protein